MRPQIPEPELLYEEEADGSYLLPFIAVLVAFPAASAYTVTMVFKGYDALLSALVAVFLIHAGLFGISIAFHEAELRNHPILISRGWVRLPRRNPLWLFLGRKEDWVRLADIAYIGFRLERREHSAKAQRGLEGAEVPRIPHQITVKTATGRIYGKSYSVLWGNPLPQGAKTGR